MNGMNIDNKTIINSNNENLSWKKFLIVKERTMIIGKTYKVIKKKKIILTPVL
jgi:hypothetical protein